MNCIFYCPGKGLSLIHISVSASAETVFVWTAQRACRLCGRPFGFDGQKKSPVSITMVSEDGTPQARKYSSCLLYTSIGKGDMLYAPLGEGKPTRVQGCFISSDEIEAVIAHIKQTSTAEYLSLIHIWPRSRPTRRGTSPARAREPGGRPACRAVWISPSFSLWIFLQPT